MTSEQLKELNKNEILRKRLAKYLALKCFRNSKLEDLHAGIGPSSKTGKYDDVKVITPYGEIEWNNLSRLNDKEMKALMIDVVNRTYGWLSILLMENELGEKTIDSLKERDMVPYWDEPEFDF